MKPYLVELWQARYNIDMWNDLEQQTAHDFGIMWWSDNHIALGRTVLCAYLT